jgi:hypothetical protein
MRSLIDGCRTFLRPLKRLSFLALFFVLFAAPSMAQAGKHGTLDPIDQILFMFAAITSAIAGFLGKLIVSMLDVMIPIMQYQGFTTASAVIGGWSIVRDTVNMFFVVILIVIAFGTIFGHQKFKWQSQVPKLLIFAIVINFSKTLCGIMIDFAQVVMLTFANALKDVAGGNFVQLLGLSDMMQVSSNATAIKDAQKKDAPGTTAFDYFAAGCAAVFMMLWVTTVVFILLAVLVYRIVMLWILIVMAPLAWFAGGIPEDFHIASSAYADWWKNFICYTAIGPVLVFFLWLTLAIAGNGQIAANDPSLNQVFTGASSTSGLEASAGDFLTKVFELQRLASFIIGMAMLMAGLDAAAKLCEAASQGGKYSMKSLLGQTKTNHAANAVKRGGELGWQGTKKIAPYAGKAGAYAALAGVGTMTAGGIAAGNVLARTNVGKKMGMKEDTSGFKALDLTKPHKRAEIMRDMAKSADKMGIGGIPVVGRGLVGALNKTADSEQKAGAEAIKASLPKGYADESFDSKMSAIHQFAKMDPKAPMLPGTKKELLARLNEAIKDPKIRAQMDADGTLKKMWGAYGKELKDKTKGTEMGKAFDDFEKGRPDLAGTLAQVTDKDGVLAMDAAALADGDAQSRVANIMSDKKDEHGNYLKMGEAIEKGLYGDARKDAWVNGRSAIYANMKPKNFAAVPLSHMAGSINANVLNKQGEPLKARLRNASQKTWNAVTNTAVKDEVLSTGGISGGSVADAAKFRSAMDETSGRFLEKAADAAPMVRLNVATGAQEVTEYGKQIASNLNAGDMSNLASQYSGLSSEGRAEMDKGVISDLRTALTQIKDAGGREGAAAEQQLAQLNSQISAMQKQEFEKVQQSWSRTFQAHQQALDELQRANEEYARVMASSPIDASVAKARVDRIKKTADDTQAEAARLERELTDRGGKLPTL